MRKTHALLIIASFALQGRPLRAESPSPPAPAETQAQERADQAFVAYQHGDFGTSIRLYREAYDFAPIADILYNIARIYDAKLGDRPLAVEFYRRFVADPGADPNRVKRASERIAALRDEETSATRPIREAQPSTAHPPDDRSPAVNSIALALAVGGVAGIGIGVGFGLSALSKASTARDLCEPSACRSQAGIEAVHDASSRATVSTVGFVAGGVLLAGGAALYFLGKPDGRHSSGFYGRAIVGSSRMAVEIGSDW